MGRLPHGSHTDEDEDDDDDERAEREALVLCVKNVLFSFLLTKKHPSFLEKSGRKKRRRKKKM